MTTDLTEAALDELQRDLDGCHEYRILVGRDNLKAIIAAARQGIAKTCTCWHGQGINQKCPTHGTDADQEAIDEAKAHPNWPDRPDTHGSEDAMRDPLSSPYSPQGPTGDWTNDPPDWRDAKTEKECNKRLFAADSLKERLRRCGCKTSGCEHTRYEAIARIEELEGEIGVTAVSYIKEREENQATITKLEAENKKLLMMLGGKEAFTTIATLEADNKRLREALEEVLALLCIYYPPNSDGSAPTIAKARAALSGGTNE